MDRKNIKITGENAADRMTYVGEITTIGEKTRKAEILQSMPDEWQNLHKSGYIHIHDLDAYGFTYNCLAFDITQFFPYDRYQNLSWIGKVISLFDFLKEYLTKLGNEQSGGMGFANFDNDVAAVLVHSGVDINNISIDVLRSSLFSFILWCNNSHERMGKVSYYVTLNLGLAKTELARVICREVLDVFEHTNPLIFKPNIIFKVKDGVNHLPKDPNYDLFQKALRVTTIKMIPTYVLCDSAPNKSVSPERLVIMGCRTRVVDDKYGEKGSVGRGNIAYISLNLPRLAMESILDVKDALSLFYNKLDHIASITVQILIDRYNALIKSRNVGDFITNNTYDAWVNSFRDHSLDEIFQHGTLSIGFIGLSETVEILTKKIR